MKGPLRFWQLTLRQFILLTVLVAILVWAWRAAYPEHYGPLPE